MTFGLALWSAVLRAGGPSTVARELGVARWTLYRWRMLSTPDDLTRKQVRRIMRRFPNLTWNDKELPHVQTSF